MSQGWRTYQEFQQESEEAGLHAEPADAPQRAGAFDISCEDLDLFCESHLDLASDAAVQRKQQMQRRLAFVQNLWNDSDRFDGVVASGRYLKLCNLTEWISDYDERAWERVKSEILAARQKSASSLS
ncbi:MAG: hypothetical protein WCF20_01415 [Methylovirgula sp.]